MKKLILSCLKELRSYIVSKKKPSESETALIADLVRILEGQTLNHLNVNGAYQYSYNIHIIDGRYLSEDDMSDEVFKYDVEIEIGTFIELSRITYNNLILTSYVNSESNSD